MEPFRSFSGQPLESRARGTGAPVEVRKKVVDLRSTSDQHQSFVILGLKPRKGLTVKKLTEETLLSLGSETMLAMLP